MNRLPKNFISSILLQKDLVFNMKVTAKNSMGQNTVIMSLTKDKIHIIPEKISRGILMTIFSPLNELDYVEMKFTKQEFIEFWDSIQDFGRKLEN